MTVYELKRNIESLGNTMNFCIEDVFSWRGFYAEPACSISSRNTSKKHNLKMLNRILTETFYGWKGGEYNYDINSEIHFECEWSSWSNGKYIDKFLSMNENNEDVKSIFI